MSHGKYEALEADYLLERHSDIWRRQELSAITDTRVELSLRQPDESTGKWLDEDPGLNVIQRVIAAGR